MSVATALILAVRRPQALPERLQGLGALAVADEDHRAAAQVQDHGQVAMPLADGDLVDGDLLELLQLGLAEAALDRCALLDVLDDVPTDLQVLGPRPGWSCAATVPGRSARRRACRSAADRRRRP